MTYFNDGSVYSFLSSQRGNPNVYNVGWLDSALPFPAGKTSEKFCKHLRWLCENAVQFKCKGTHSCQFCLKHGQPALGGNGEIRIPELRNQRIWAAPQLIAHYVEVHNYQPHPDFIRAVELYEPKSESTT